MTRATDVVVVGAGQAGLSVSHELTRRDVDHIVLERGEVGQTWRDRWDSFCLVTPNWTVQLPGHHYDGDDPDGFMPRDEIVAYLERYASGFDAPVEGGVEVTRLRRDPSAGFVLETSSGELRAGTVVLSTGAYQRPHRPPAATGLPADLLQLDVDDYRNAAELPDGPVLVVGSGQSGCQIAEELHEAGRDVFLACGRAPWITRRIGEHDFTWWADRSGFLEDPVDTLAGPADRLFANLLATGHGGGHDLHLRTLQAQGITLLGHFAAADGRRARFATDLAPTVAWGDWRNAMMMRRFANWADEAGVPRPDPEPPAPIETDSPEELDLTGFGAVLFASGFRPDYASWVECEHAFDELGFPIHADGECTTAPGLHFVGVHFLRRRRSSLLIGVGEDAALTAARIATERASAR
jgi:putative flavoprotein involved in K+ transport